MPFAIDLLLLFGILFALLATGMWIPVALGLTALVFPLVVGEPFNYELLGNIAYNNVNSFTLTAIPLFVLMGELIVHSGISKRFYRAAARWADRAPGGLLHANVAVAGILAAVTGSSVATAGAVGAAAIPEMHARGYAARLTYGSITGGGMLGILIPPSIILIVYGALAQQSVTDLFLAGAIPGVALMACFLAYIGVRVKLRPSLAPTASRSPGNPSERSVGVRDAVTSVLPVAILIVAVLGSIYQGIATPTEAGAIGVLGAFLIALCYRTVTVANLVQALRATVNVTCMILFIVVGAAVYSYAIVSTGISRTIAVSIVDMGLPSYALLAAIAIIYLLLGLVIDGVSIIFLTLPLLLPVIEDAGINLILFGVLVVMLVEIGQVTPPMGINNLVVQGIDRGARLAEVVKGSLPFAVITLSIAVLLALVPDIALWLVD